jgi:hypothetical protein
MPVQFSCPISGVGGVKQFGMCVLNTESELTGDESHRNSWAPGDAHIHLLYHGAFVPVVVVRAAVSPPTIHFPSFHSYHKVCTADVHEIFIFAFHYSHLQRRYGNEISDICIPGCLPEMTSTNVEFRPSSRSHVLNFKLQIRFRHKFCPV